MRAVVLFLAALALGMWSLFCWAVYGFLGFAGTFAAENIGLLPFPPELVLWSVDLLGGMGGVAVWIVWALGAAAIALATLIPLAFLRRRPAIQPGPAVDMRRDSDPAPPVGVPRDDRSRAADDAVARVLGRSPRR